MKITLTLSLLLALCPTALARPDTPAERALALARRGAAERPEDPRAHVALAMAHARRAREVADPEQYALGRAALERALALDEDDFEARKAEVWLLLGEHRFPEAREKALALNRRAPDDLAVYGFLVDAAVELGDLDAAEEAAQWMLDLRPGNVPGLCRAAHLRELWGDVDGALELLVLAYHGLPAAEVEERAWVLTRMGVALDSVGREAAARRALEQALDLFPDYHYALAGLARVEAAAGEHGRAIELLRRRHAVAPHPENLLDLAHALEDADREDEARPLLERFEREARAESDAADNANRELALHLADRGPEAAAEARALLVRELERRRGVRTTAAHAWTLFRTGDLGGARAEIEAALAPGLRDAELFHRAGVIAAAQDDVQAARAWLEQSLALRPGSRHAAEDRALLARLAQLEGEGGRAGAASDA